MKRLAPLFAVCSIMVLTLHWSPVLAAPDDTTAVVPYGSWIESLVGALSTAILSLAAAVFAWFLAQAPALVRPFVMMARVDQLFERAIQSALAQVKTAAHGKTLELPVANALVRHAFEFVLANAPKTVLDYIGTSVSAIMPKLLARAQEAGVLPPDYDTAQAASAVTTAAKTPQAARAKADAAFAGQGLRPAQL